MPRHSFNSHDKTERYWHLGQGAICKPKILITYLDEIVSFMGLFLLLGYLLSYLDYSHAFACGADLFEKFWIWLTCILITWPIPPNQILFWWIYCELFVKYLRWICMHGNNLNKTIDVLTREWQGFMYLHRYMPRVSVGMGMGVKFVRTYLLGVWPLLYYI